MSQRQSESTWKSEVGGIQEKPPFVLPHNSLSSGYLGGNPKGRLSALPYAKSLGGSLLFPGLRGLVGVQQRSVCAPVADLPVFEALPSWGCGPVWVKGRNHTRCWVMMLGPAPEAPWSRSLELLAAGRCP